MKPVPAGGAHSAGTTGTPLPGMHPPPFLPSRRTPILAETVPSPAEPAEPLEAAPLPVPEPPTTVDWLDAMPMAVAGDEVDAAAEQETRSPDEAMFGAERGATADFADVEPAPSLEADAARVLRTLADRIDAGELRLAPLPDVRSDAALLTVVLAALLASHAPGPDDAGPGTVGGAASSSAD